MSTQKMPSISREDYIVPVSVRGIDAELIVTLPVQFAFLQKDDPPVVPAPEPEDEDWLDGEWMTDESTPTARILIGQGSPVPLANGAYYVWTQVVGARVKPARNVGTLVVT